MARGRRRRCSFARPVSASCKRRHRAIAIPVSTSLRQARQQGRGDNVSKLEVVRSNERRAMQQLKERKELHALKSRALADAMAEAVLAEVESGSRDSGQVAAQREELE